MFPLYDGFLIEKERMRDPSKKTSPNGRRTLQSELKRTEGQVHVCECVCVRAQEAKEGIRMLL